MEFYSRPTPAGDPVDSNALKLALPLNQIASSFRTTPNTEWKEELISQKVIRFKDKFAVETKILSEFPPNEDGLKDVIIHSIMFLHHGKVVNLAVYVKPEDINDAKVTCFFDAVKIW